MRRLLLVPLAVSLFGCGAAEFSGVSERPINRAVASQLIEYIDPSPTCLPNGRRRLSLGEDSTRALVVFPRPSRGFPLDESVPGLPEGFKSIGWESNTDGFGAVTYDDKIVLIMRQYESLDAEQFAQTLQAVQQSNPHIPWSFVEKGSTSYWTGGDATSKTTISRVNGKEKTYQVTISVGEPHLMDAIGLIPKVATNEESLAK